MSCAGQKILIRRAKPTDLLQIMAIERASFPTPWSEQGMRRELENQNGSIYLVVEQEGKILGYVGAWTYAAEAHILTIAVHEDVRRKGLVVLLMLAILREAAARGCVQAVLEYRCSNAAAGALYSKLGFRPYAIRRGYYADTHEDAVCAVLTALNSPQRRRELDEALARWMKNHDWDVEFER